MPKDVIVVVTIDAKPRAAESLDILLISTAGRKSLATYRSLEEIQAAFPVKFGANQRIYNKAAAMFNQGKTTLANSLIRKVKIVGFEEPVTPIDLITDIEALQEEDNDWYVYLTDRDGDEYVQALAQFAEKSEPTESELAAGIEDHRKFYFGQTDSLTIAGEYRRSAIIYTDTANITEEADAAYLGNVGPFYPKSVTWKFKTPDGITAPSMTYTQRDALEARNINFLTEEYKRKYVKNGVCWDGEFIDVQMGADYIASAMRGGLYDVLQSNTIVPYSDEGFAMAASAVFAALNRATALGIIARDPESGAGVFTVSVPKRADATDDQAKARMIPDIGWEAILEGAVHSVKVKGALRAALSA